MAYQHNRRQKRSLTLCEGSSIRLQALTVFTGGGNPLSVEETGVWTEVKPKERCPFCDGRVSIRIIEILIGERNFWKFQFSDDNNCPLSQFFDDGSLRAGPSKDVCDGLVKEWHEIVETVRNIAECPECGSKPECQCREDSSRWIVACRKGHMRADAAYVLPALKDWNKNVEQYIQDHRSERLARCLTEFWHQEDTSNKNLPEFMRQSWREKHADWERK